LKIAFLLFIIYFLYCFYWKFY